jgi:hypothetical protein
MLHVVLGGTTGLAPPSLSLLMEQVPAFESKPDPVTEMVIDASCFATEGEMVILGSTVNSCVPLSPPHVTMSVYGAPPGPLGPVPTVKEPYATSENTAPMEEATVPLPPVTEQAVKSAVPGVTPVALKRITSPALP